MPQTATTSGTHRRPLADRARRPGPQAPGAGACTTEHADLHVELITAEVAHQLAMARNALRTALSRQLHTADSASERHCPVVRRGSAVAQAAAAAATGRLRSTARAIASL